MRHITKLAERGPLICAALFGINLSLLAPGNHSVAQTSTNHADTAHSPRLVDLSVMERTILQVAPPLLIAGGVKCDEEGNLYMAYSDTPQAVLGQAGGPGMLPVLRISQREKTAVTYPFPAIPDYEIRQLYDFSVDSRGTLYELVGATKRSQDADPIRPQSFILTFKDDGSADSVTPLGDIRGTPALGKSLAVLPRQEGYLITGMLPKSADRPSFTAIFDRRGAFVSNVEGPGEGNALDSSDSSKVADLEQRIGQARGSRTSPTVEVSGRLLATGWDGNAYLLAGNDQPNLYTISPSGAVLRSVRIIAPEDGVGPVQIGPAGERAIYIVFQPVAGVLPAGPGSAPREAIVLVSTGVDSEQRAYLPSQTGLPTGIPACVQAPGEFVFVGASSGKGEEMKMEIVRYSSGGD